MTAPGEEAHRLPYVPGIDGLRAIAVVAVALFHASLSWAPFSLSGGFLGVDVFFVISGYLITSLLIAEWRRNGRVGLGDFWFRRARRLLPAVFVLILGLAWFTIVFLPAEVAALRRDALAAAGYVTNWYLIFDQESYFESWSRPSLLRHLWSLAIEEQFYILWPIVFAVVFSRLRSSLAALGLMALAIASTLLMAVVYNSGHDVSRVYYGTDTRASSLLLGAALAFVWSAPGAQSVVARISTRVTDVGGVVALSGVILLMVWLGADNPFLYQGGFLLSALLTCLLIASLVRPGSALAAALGRQPLRWIGLRSYAIYLWHWPVIVLTRPGVDVPLDGPALLATQLVITCGLAEVSYRLIEFPIRSGILGRAWQSLRASHGRRRWSTGARWAAPGTALAAAAAIVAVLVIGDRSPEAASSVSVDAVHIVSPRAARAEGATRVVDPRTPATSGTVIHEPGGSPSPHSDAGGAAAPTPADRPPVSYPAPVYYPVAGVDVTALGDSVMVGAAAELASVIDRVEVDAAVSRQAQVIVDIVTRRAADGTLGDAVVIHTGTNGIFTAGQFDTIMHALADKRIVVFVNVKVPRDWEGPNNAVIANGVARYGNAALVDWYAASVGRPELFGEDSVHLTYAGIRLYTSLITSVLAAHAPTPEPTLPPVTPPPPTSAPTPTSAPPTSSPAPTPSPMPTPSAGDDAASDSIAGGIAAE